MTCQKQNYIFTSAFTCWYVSLLKERFEEIVLILWRTPHLGSDGQICGTRLSSSIQMTLELEQ